MKREISISEALELRNAVFIDLRSESEYKEATIPGAINLPIFSDHERSQIGLTYRKTSPAEARLLGLDIVAPKLPFLIRTLGELARKQPVIIFCWRGGQRSLSIAAVCQLMGIPVLRLNGGYKAFRKQVFTYLWEMQTERRCVVLHGLTGVGKTDFIQLLKQRGIAALDIEQLACNRGSVFGGINMPEAPSQKNFEGRLAMELWSMQSSSYYVVECESRKIGKLTLPPLINNGMKTALRILLFDPNLDRRAERLVSQYVSSETNNNSQLLWAISQLSERLGTKLTEDLKNHVRLEQYPDCAKKLLIHYYDPLYGYPDQPDSQYDLCLESSDYEAGIERIIEFLDKNAATAVPWEKKEGPSA